MPFGGVKEEPKPVEAPAPTPAPTSASTGREMEEVKGSGRKSKWFKFTNVGEAIEGVWNGTFTTNSPQYGVKTAGKLQNELYGEVFISFTADLSDKLPPIPIGTFVRIVFKERKGNVKVFDVTKEKKV